MKKLLLIGLCIVLLSSFVSALQKYPATDPFGSLLVGWYLNGTDEEILGSGNGTIVGCSWNSSSPYGATSQSLYCKGQDDNYFNTDYYSSFLDVGKAYTISCWIKGVGQAPTADYEWSIFGTNNVGTIANIDFYIGKDGDTQMLNYQRSSAENGIKASSAERSQLLNNDWYMLTVTSDGGGTASNLHTYLNDTECSSAGVWDSAINPQPTLRPLYIMARNANGADEKWFKGNVAGCYIWNQSLDLGEIQTLYEGNYSSASGPPPIDVVIDKPLNNAGFGLAQLAGNKSKIYINGTFNTSSSTVCTLNDSDWTSTGPNPAMGFNFTFLNNTLITEGNRDITVSCNLTGTSNGTATVKFKVDIVSPIITGALVLEANQTVVYNGTLITHLNFTDTAEIYSINVSLANHTQLSYVSNYGGTTNTTYINFGIDDQHHTLISKVCDAHTLNSISDTDRIIFDNGGVKYVIKDNPLFLKDEWIHIYPKNTFGYVTAESIKATDRYSPIFNKKSLPEPVETFIIESSYNIDIIESQLYGGHVVIKDIGTDGWWADTNMGGSKYVIRRINEFRVEVDVYGLKSPTIVSNSIGELNCVTKHFAIGNLNPVERFTTPILTSQFSSFLLNVSRDSRTMTTINATLYYNNTPNYAGLVDNYSATLLSPSIVSGKDINISFNWIIDVDGTKYNLTAKKQNVSNIYIDNCTTYTTKTINFTLIDTTTGGYITDYDFEGNFVLWSENILYSKTFVFDLENQNINNEICIFPKFANLTANYETLFIRSGYETSFYVVGGGYLDNITQTISINMVNSSLATAITFTVVDENDDPLEGYIVELHKYNLGNNSYSLVTSTTTDSGGQIKVGLDVSTYEYKIIIKNPSGTIVKTVSKQKLTLTEYVIQVVLGTTPEVITVGLYDLNVDLTKDRSNKNFNLTWDEISYAANEIKLVVLRTNSTNGTRTLSTQTSTANSGKLGYHINETTTGISVTFLAVVYIKSSSDSQYYFLDSESMDFRKEWDIFNAAESITMAFIFVGTMIFVGLAFSAEASIILGITGMILAWLGGFMMVSLSALAGIIIAFVIILIKMEKR